MKEIIPGQGKVLISPIEIKAPVKQEYRFIGPVRKIPGCKLWMYDPADHSIKEVPVRATVAVGLDGLPHTQFKAMHNPDALYMQAINKKNAARKFVNYLTKINTLPNEPNN